MGIAATVERHLIRHRIPYDVVAHQHTESSTASAQTAGVPPARIAKGVLLGDRQGYVMVVIPANHYVKLNTVRGALGRDQLDMADETQLSEVFQDCELGAVPALGPAYGLETIVDEKLAKQKDIYIEGGDHEELIHLSSARFFSLLGSVTQGDFSHPR